MAEDESADSLSDDEIDVSPTKALFVEMLTRDIQLDRAVLDLVDNSIDGAKKLRPNVDDTFEGLEVKIALDADKFIIADNCGGIGIDVAKHYAFRFGRPKGMARTPGSVGQFGVGMKRALFKFGHSFEIISTTTDDRFELRVNVDVWENEVGPWRFSFDSTEADLSIPISDTGTTITTTPLRQDARAQFGSPQYRSYLGRQIEAAQQQYIDRGLRIVFDGKTLIATPWKLLAGNGVEPMFEEDDVPVEGKLVHRRVYTGVGLSSSQEAGWYVFCNGRMILAADQTPVTGWETGSDEQSISLPKYHGQFSRFRGFVFLDAEDASLLPWNTTKTGVDADTDVWRSTLLKMRSATRPVIDFLNRLDAERDEPGGTLPLSKAVSSAALQALRFITRKGPFAAPQPPKGPKPPPQTSIQFGRLKSEVDELKDFYGASSNTELGQMLFDEAYQEHVGS